MTFDLHIHGDTPAELLEALTQLGGTTNIVNSPAPAQTPLPQNEPMKQPDKPKAPAPAKAKKTVQKPAASQEEKPASPPTSEAPSANIADASGAPTANATTEPDTATLDKIRDLARSLIVHGKRAEVQTAIKNTGAASISKLPPDSYTAVWEQLVNLSKEVDTDAAD